MRLSCPWGRAYIPLDDGCAPRMLKLLRSLVPGARGAVPAVVPRVPEGERVYAVGDIHGRLDLFGQMLERIAQDDAGRRAARTCVVLLGDLIDRGADSAGVVALARDWEHRQATGQGPRASLRVLAGNHEEMFLDSLESDEILRHFLRHGGRETLFSYGLDPRDYARMTIEEVRAAMPALVPAADIAFIRAMEDQVRIGDYVFVHAGIRPGVALEDQTLGDLRWIRGEFLDSSAPRDFVVVHGHTITPEPEILPLRIGIDTGAYASGRLTAVGLEGADRWVLDVCGEPREVVEA